MELPKINTAALPDLDDLTGVYGSQQHPAPAAGSDDAILILMAWIYEIV
ncbi:MAG: hypothetical protein JSS36_09795 [Proteobacteria bacterium]|nr:hypothetical protein [Pseudomonadota bacterium]